MTSITRPTQGRVIAGVCRGIADSLDVDVTIVRVVTAALVLLAGSGPLIYLLAWALIPAADDDQSIAEKAASKAAEKWRQRQSDQAPAQPEETFNPYEDK